MTVIIVRRSPLGSLEKTPSRKPFLLDLIPRNRALDPNWVDWRASSVPIPLVGSFFLSGIPGSWGRVFPPYSYSYCYCYCYCYCYYYYCYYYYYYYCYCYYYYLYYCY